MKGDVYNDQTRVGKQFVNTLVDSFVQFIFLLLKEFIVIHRKVAKRYTSDPQSHFSDTTIINIFQMCASQFSSGQMGRGDFCP